MCAIPAVGAVRALGAVCAVRAVGAVCAVRANAALCQCTRACMQFGLVPSVRVLSILFDNKLCIELCTV